MANILIVVDSETDRRSQFIKMVEARLPILPGLRTAFSCSGDFCAIWAASPTAPISEMSDAQGVAVLWGDAISSPGSRRITAGELRHLWKDCAERCPAPFDGFHAGVVYTPQVGVTVGADLLGMFPIYYYATDTLLLVGSSPELFRYHPAFSTQFNPAALVSILLVMHPIGGDTLFQGVRRLEAGNLLLWRSGDGAKEKEQYRVSVSDRYFGLPFSAQVELIDETLHDSMIRHAPPTQKYGLLLSGGRDSRIVGGYLKQQKAETVALTLANSPFELDLEIAQSVAQTLGFEHRRGAIPQDEYCAYAELHAQWTHGLCGFDTMMFWGMVPHLRQLPPYVVTGYLMDPIIGGSQMHWPFDHATKTMSFNAFFDHINSFGFHPNILRRLMSKSETADAVSVTINSIRSTFDNYGEFEFQRAWCFNLYHRLRFFIGGIVWQASFGAWPIVPSVDRDVLAVTGAVPASTLAERRAQDDLMCKRFPELAAIPLESGCYHPDPLLPRLRWRLQRAAEQRLPLIRRLQSLSESGKGERRFYHTLWDVNGPGWMSVRWHAEQYRHGVTEWLDKDVLHEVLPAPHVSLTYDEPIAGASGLKSLLGLVLWSKDHT